jgi:acyl-CoA reductase-like NAD-dependent aldehyde dehydrogenase
MQHPNYTGAHVDTIEIRAPHDRSLLGSVPVDDAASIERKVATAQAAMTGWAAKGPMERATALLAIGVGIRSEWEPLARELSLEQGKTLKEARNEIDRLVGIFEQYAGLGTGVGGRRHDLGNQVAGHVQRRPIGVVAGIVPWNFPASIYGTKLAPALAAGCGFLIKPAETTTLITVRLTEIIARHLPAGLVDVVVGGPAVGAALVGHPDVRKVTFTGSTGVGREIAKLAAEGLKQVTLELGGCDPFVLLEDADLPAAARAIMGTRFFNAGQVCVAPKRLIAHRAVIDEMVELLSERLRRVTPGPGLDPASTMGPLHTERGRTVLEAQVADAVDRGATLIGGGRPATDATAEGSFVNPGLLLDPPAGARVRQEETFGPVLTVVPVDSDDEAVRIANETPYGLGCSVWSRDSGRAFALAHQINAGYTWVNALGRVYDELPFGGTKASGYGREHGVEALGNYLEDRTFVYPS